MGAVSIGAADPSPPASPAPAANPAKPTPAPVGAVAPLERVVAFVDGEPIWGSRVSELRASAPAQGSAEPSDAALIDQLIDEAVVLHRANAMHVDVGESEIDTAVAEIMKTNNLDKAGLDAALAQYGYTLAHYRDELRNQILVLRTFNQAQVLPAGTTSDERERRRAAWIADLRRAARIERR